MNILWMVDIFTKMINGKLIKNKHPETIIDGRVVLGLLVTELDRDIPENVSEAITVCLKEKKLDVAATNPAS